MLIVKLYTALLNGNTTSLETLLMVRTCNYNGGPYFEHCRINICIKISWGMKKYIKVENRPVILFFIRGF